MFIARKASSLDPGSISDLLKPTLPPKPVGFVRLTAVEALETWQGNHSMFPFSNNTFTELTNPNMETKVFINNSNFQVSSNQNAALAITNSETRPSTTALDPSLSAFSSFSSSSSSSYSRISSSSCDSSAIFTDIMITDDEFIAMLPPVPEYSQNPRPEELVVPDGKAIDLLMMVSTRPTFDPPDYEPVREEARAWVMRRMYEATNNANESNNNNSNANTNTTRRPRLSLHQLQQNQIPPRIANNHSLRRSRPSPFVSYSNIRISSYDSLPSTSTPQRTVRSLVYRY
ncbi:hypothetical protein DAMA08_042810 [Martiniozyma asiatica (nom. inval.)]|nr:hypothetical protein DAMA08_027120 [Martiniozyma asiatica]GMM31536.1 hypothetical protein DAMA08_042810 [Martiniozyma asiatica]